MMMDVGSQFLAMSVGQNVNVTYIPFSGQTTGRFIALTLALELSLGCHCRREDPALASKLLQVAQW